MLFCTHFLSLFLLPSLGTSENWKVVNGTIGSSVFLDPEHQGNLSRSEILWTFTGSNRCCVPILDYVPDEPVEQSNEQFRSRLQFNASTGCLLVDGIKSEDQGVYNFDVDGRRTTTIELLLFAKLSKALISYSAPGYTIQLTCEVDGKPQKYEWLRNGREMSQRHWLINENRSLIILTDLAGECGTYTCVASNPVSSVQANYTLNPPVFQSLVIWNILSVVGTFVALISWIAIKGAVFISVVALCTVSALFLAIITSIVILKFGCSFNGNFLGKNGSQPFIDLSGFIIIPISITLLKEEVQQNNQSCHTSILEWSIPIALLVSCVIMISVFLATHHCKCHRNINENIEVRQQNNEESSDFTTTTSEQGATSDLLQTLQNGYDGC
ncbi:hepatic and glial cell adhesion molecule-like isoform X2 [Mobula hypostoma]|uniref:hepatic and glial cell adhesion molecule-like isoform X2 n=1 Tax=Mobula hypostoma TaxID=723540 RepID=UPI002FC2CE5B